MKSQDYVLIIFCKWPRLNQGKQRLAKTIGASNAFRLASLLVDCALEDAKDWDGEVVLAISDASDFEQASQAIQKQISDNQKISIQVQSKGNLGQRINHIDQNLRERGKNNLLFIGTDAPVLNPLYYQQAKEAITSSDIVISDASDGGVIIMGNRKAWPDLTFLPWSTEKLSKKLSRICAKQRLSVTRIKPGFDIDVEKDLEKLFVAIDSDSRRSRIALRQWLVNYLETNQELINAG
ncbi:DUF2064 domain-containing protein [Aliikangiella coralliicola]|uniref:DUF2064 domain-containing protein n=1 Tax=Aliikangiella coralliicola TaxID=2592383 RepID=A0A545UF74_9GAMM|nr:DUF2064 domain-containing protein [Aliikangiella coralliicola]TQV88127.1 DUF2064 domain-containing protein [Aliikangiella coralliicola]